ncbi:hypothetical protein GCM10025882_40620 [Acinetobacter gyllenbergii]|jgi:hypothetical protein|uniref:Uncharacterized protein n=2 Tax=Acinetobacter TaxID=469 RepID=A0A829HF62_9GAMM|nr:MULTISPECIES: hypothetical protein [Acinetobacter]MDC5432292.1 hypothetical protein [Acinetobacter baumannii]APR69925.1 hypothetical protein AHTJS_05680 [Acinetobacter haemolyticus]AZN68631.1 hypothetical protein DX910_10565 [Acinetobacter haemolyticus]EPF74426.1 hypothetical protein F957_03523 [Acinetobacter gyllenbergii CIP 110306 = MTCC 11365]EPH30901.1 hypothetical protein L293_2661 [Acinetobacter gyllenbergii CIP 110306 = MTCC 11365]|tara:strand:+ start:125 stop:820 length:696 start_codon:yes stop_codon:yes gene_type:complete
MARTRLTVDEMILSVEKHLKQIARRTHSDELILQLIRSKTANQFTEEDIKNLRNKYHKVLELNRLEEVMDTICSIKKSDRSDIEKDIVDFSGYEDPFSQTDERLKIALRMLKNYNRRVPDLIKQKAHDEIKNSFHSSYRQVKQKIKDRKQENHEKFFLGSVLISFFKSQNIEMNYLENTLKMIELYQIKNYFRKELFLESEIKEFKFSEQGRSFNDKKNAILSDPKNPFKK